MNSKKFGQYEFPQLTCIYAYLRHSVEAKQRSLYGQKRAYVKTGTTRLEGGE